MNIYRNDSSLGSSPIYLVGYMGSGKSTIGRMLAETLGFQFVDTDIFIESRFRSRVIDIFRQEGEETFRRREKEVVMELSGMTKSVIATGGGLPCHSNNMDLMNECGITVYLKMSDKALASRLDLCKRTRPTIKGKSAAELFEHVQTAMIVRRPIYEQAAIIYPAEKLVDKHDEKIIAQAIAAELHTYASKKQCK